ncbi:hypothetical protein FRB98_001567 [Tulasnella sp. 332]|nr:hypothetical protein FRB98_001567 [Tulasnella sp. 332]
MDTPLSFYALPVLYITALYPLVASGAVVKQALGRSPPNTNPRSNIDWCKKKGVSDDVVQKLERMRGAHINGLENWPVYAVSILAANVSGVDHRTTNIAAAALVVARVLYNGMYINGTTGFIAGLR